MSSQLESDAVSYAIAQAGDSTTWVSADEVAEIRKHYKVLWDAAFAIDDAASAGTLMNLDVARALNQITIYTDDLRTFLTAKLLEKYPGIPEKLAAIRKAAEGE